MADRLVQQDPGPPGAEHDRHVAGRRGHGLHVHRGLPHGLACYLQRPLVRGHEAEIPAPAAARVALLAPPVVLHDYGHVEAHERPHVRRERAIGALHEYHFVDTCEARDDLCDARIHRAGAPIDVRQELHLVAILHAHERIDDRIQHLTRRGRARHDFEVAAALSARDAARGGHGIEQRGLVELIRVRKSGPLPGDRPHADALVDAVDALLDDAVLDGPGLEATHLKVQIGVVEVAGHCGGDCAIQGAQTEPAALEHELARDRDGIDSLGRLLLGFGHLLNHSSRRCLSTGNLFRSSASALKSRSAHTTPAPASRSARISPQGPMIIE